MSGTITNGLTALLANQRALQTTSNNIANANTPGYVRQRTEFAANPGVPIGRTTIGNGVSVTDITRIYDQYLTDNLRSATSLEQRYSVLATYSTRLNGILGNPDTGIGAAIQRFFDQVDAVGRDPTSVAQREQLLLEGSNLAGRFRQLDDQLEAIATEINNRLQSSATAINQLASQLASINDKIMSSGSTESAALLDQRDQLLKAIGGQIDITTVRQQDGSVNVLVGSGQPLVLGSRSLQITTMRDPYDASLLQLAIDNGSSPQNISGKISGGAVGGLLAFRVDVLETSRRELGQLAVGIAEAFNAQHRQGMDLNGDLGTNFFATTPPVTSASTTNTGTSVLTAVIADASALAGRDYEARYNGTAWSVVDRRSGAVVPSTGAATAGSPLVFEGLSVTASAGAAAGDRFLIRPAAAAAAQSGVVLGSAAQIAAAVPVVSSIGAANASQATIGTAAVTDVSDPKLLAGATILFDSPTSYVVFTGSGADLVGPLPYTSGQAITFGGWSVPVSGAPQTGDRFFVSAASAGSGDNRNALALSSVAQKGFFVGGTQSLADLGADIAATVGSAANRATNDSKVQEGLREQAEIDVENVSGVNLDEEAANMLRYQQAYLAASKVIGMADELFRTLLQVAGR